MKSSISSKLRGFTLIEVAAVIFIMALLAGATVLSLAHVADRQKSESLRDQLERVDNLVRSAARQGSCCQQLIYDLDDKTVLWPQTDSKNPLQMIQLKQQDTLEVIEGEQEFTSGQVAIDFSPDGYSHSYALKLVDPLQDAHWMVVAGLSGRISWTENQKRVDAIFRSLSTEGLRATAVEVPDENMVH